MIAELGHFALIIALGFALMQTLVPMVGSFKGYTRWMRLGHSLSYGQFFFIAISFGCLTAAFWLDDFSLK